MKKITISVRLHEITGPLVLIAVVRHDCYFEVCAVMKKSLGRRTTVELSRVVKKKKSIGFFPY